MIRHAGLIALRLQGRWAGVLVEGPSGVGKSDLMLRALDAGFRLVADDRTRVWASGGALWGRAPQPIAGLIEARGLGIVRDSALAYAEIVLLARCTDDREAIERMPDFACETLAGIAIPRLDLDPRAASAPAKLRRAMEHLGSAAQQAYQAASLGGPGRAGTGDSL